MLTFIKCGLFGWCLEIFWTGLGALFQGDGRLTGHSSLWMFPIYGLAALIGPVYQQIKPLNFLFRGFLYMLAIFAVEYVTGSVLKQLNLCPWDYSQAALNINGVIRLDYAPVWFAAGLLFERLLLRF